MRTSFKAALTAAAASLALLTPTMAFADQVDTTVGAGGATNVTISGGSAQSDITYWIFSNANMTNCDPADGSAATVTIAVSGPAGLAWDTDLGAAGDQHALTFTACGTPSLGQRQPVRFTATAAGSWGVSASVSDSVGQYNVNTAKFTFDATAPTNTKPSVTLTGVTEGASYELGQVPAAVCQASDAQDGNQPGVLTLSAITGPLASYGLGSQTATCSFTDSGSLAADPVSATYSIVDTTAPVLVAPASQVIDATSSDGAVATYEAPGVSEAVGLAAGSPQCSPGSGSTFAFGTTTVTCNASDVAGNAAAPVTFTITVKDDTAPTISGGGTPPTEATGSTTTVDYTLPTANDDVDGPLIPVCDPASGSAFAVGSTEVTCTATDAHGNSSSTGFDIVVTDTTPPAITVPTLPATEATGPEGALVTYTVSASDLVDGSVDVNCVPASGSTFALGTTTVSCTAGDALGNSDTQTFNVEVVDTTPPELTLPDDITAEATSPSGAVVGFLPTADDLVDGAVAVICDPQSGSTFGFGLTSVNCSASDANGNSASGSFTVTVQDTIAPTVSGPTRDPLAVDGVDADGLGWNKTAVMFTWTCVDSGSGVVEDTIVKTVNTEGKGQTASATCEDLAGNTVTSGDETVNVDKTAPELHITGLANGANIDVCTAAKPSFSPTDALSGVNPSTVGDSWTTPSGGVLGDYAYSAHASDYATSAASETRTFHGVYGSAFGGVLQPVNADGSSRFKLGSTVPVKFKLTCNGVPITNAQPTLRVTQGDTAPDPGVDEVASTSAATTGNLFRYDASGQQYIFNLATKPGFKNPNGTAVTFAQGTWTLSINLDDGTFRNVKIQLVK